MILDYRSLRSGAVALLWLAVAMLVASLPAHAQRRVALVIGNGAYTHAAPLPNPINDADAVGAALRRLRFDHVTVLKDLGAEAFRRALLDFEPQAAAADIAMVYFAGHGVEVDGQNFLVPTDARLVRSAAAELEAIPLSTVTSVLSPARKLRLVILDACRTNPFRARMAADGSAGRKRAIGRGLGRIEPGENELIAFAAAAGTEADDGSGLQSPFTTALLRHIETPGLDIRLMFGKVRDEVLKETQRQQTPHVYGTLGGEVIVLAPAVSGMPKPADPPPPAAASPFTSPAGPIQLKVTGRPPQGSWVKLCDKGQVKGKDGDGRDVAKPVDICITLTERIDSRSGMLLLSAALQQVTLEGLEKQTFRVTVPQGMKLSDGLELTFFPQDLWERIHTHGMLDSVEATRLKVAKLSYANCVQAGCSAEVEATPELLGLLTGGAGLLVQTVHVSAGRFPQTVSLSGFSRALTNPPTDLKKYQAARQELMKQIADRQKQLGKELKKQQ